MEYMERMVQGFSRFMGLAMLAIAVAALAYLAAACSPQGAGGIGGIAPTPAAVTSATAIDEKALAGVELAYKAMRTAGEIAVDAGVLAGDNAARVAAIDEKAYAALLLARQAYKAGNAADYGAAVGQALELIGQAQALIKPS